MNIFLLSLFLCFSIVAINFNLKKITSPVGGGRLICINENAKYFSFGNNEQIVDLLWIRFLQETDAFNESKIAEFHTCPNSVSSWHFHLLNISFDLDPKFYEMAAVGPLLVSITINDAKGASILFDKAVKNFPNNWRILYQAAYQAIFEENDFEKAAHLLQRSGQNGAPKWVFSLAGGLYNQLGMRSMADSIYQYLSENFPEDEVTIRLKNKLENKIENFYKKNISK